MALVLLLVVAGGAWWLVKVLTGEPDGANRAPPPLASATAPTNPHAPAPGPAPAPAPTPAPSFSKAAVTATSATSNPDSAAVQGPSEPSAEPPQKGAAPAGPTTVPPAPPPSAELAAAIAMIPKDPLTARRAITRLVDGTTLSREERLRAYDAVNGVNKILFFDTGITQGDPIFTSYKVEEKDTLPAIARKLKLDCDYRLLQRINAIRDPAKIKIGQVLKAPKGPFHAEVRKGEFRMNLYNGEGADRLMIASFPVGLGEFNSTPTGMFRVRPKSKVMDPPWTNPRTGEKFEPSDPKNPIGERWIGLEGIEPHNKDFAGYGIHGTIEPESIGQTRSMGCVRMLGPDVEIVYELLTEPNSTILIAP